MSDTMEEGVLVAWLVEEGTKVSAGDVIAQVETDKATMDLEVYDDGVLLKRVIAEGDAVPIGGLIAVLGAEGEDISDILSGDDGAAEADVSDAEEKAADADVEKVETAEGEDEKTQQAATTSDSAGDERIKTSPLARRMAGEHGIDLSSVNGSGPDGRIVRRDIEALIGKTEDVDADRKADKAPSVPATAAAPGDRYEDRKASQMRKTIARRLSESKFSAPHFYLTADIEMEQAVALRTRLNEVSEVNGGPKLSFNDLITKACALALQRHPDVNASYLESEGVFRYHKDVHIGIAVAIDEGLMTPVIRDADRKGLAQIADETRDLARRARDRKLDPSEWEGSTFTTSNLGMFGIEEFTAIINPPNACILAIGGIRDVPVVKDGEIVPGKRMKLTLSCDHRVVDGAKGAEFLGTVRRLLEEPMNMML